MSPAYRGAGARIYIDGVEFLGVADLARISAVELDWGDARPPSIILADTIEGVGRIDAEAWDGFTRNRPLDLREPVKMPAPDHGPPINRQQKRAAARKARKASERPGPNPRPPHMRLRDR